VQLTPGERPNQVNRRVQRTEDPSARPACSGFCFDMSFLRSVVQRIHKSAARPREIGRGRTQSLNVLPVSSVFGTSAFAKSTSKKLVSLAGGILGNGSAGLDWRPKPDEASLAVWREPDSNCGSLSLMLCNGFVLAQSHLNDRLIRDGVSATSVCDSVNTPSSQPRESEWRILGHPASFQSCGDFSYWLDSCMSRAV
jgi:hypothetical protein